MKRYRLIWLSPCKASGFGGSINADVYDRLRDDYDTWIYTGYSVKEVVRKLRASGVECPVDRCKVREFPGLVNVLRNGLC